MEIFNPNAAVRFMRFGRITVPLAVFLVLASLVLILTRGFNYGLDFTGGVVVQVEYSQHVSAADVRTALDKGGFENSVVQPLSGTNDVSIRLQPKDDSEAVTDTGAPDVDRISRDLLTALNVDGKQATLKARSFVGPQVGQSLRTKGIYATIFVILGVVIYLWIRYERRFAIAAVLTEVHDVLVTVGIFALTQRQFDLTVLASVMAVVGYSINDKVVVFDRVRELFRLARKADPEEILDRSINNTLSRTIMTSALTAISMLALWLMGGQVVHGFAITMLIGIVVGTLSSIFIACPILMWLGVSKRDLMPRAKDSPELARRP